MSIGADKPIELKPEPLNCIFCRIAKHDVPAKIVLEDAEFIAFYDINPVSKGHTLVIPKAHIRDFSALVTQPAEFIKRYLQFVEKVRLKLRELYKPRGIFIRWNTDALLEVNHVHAHVVPVY